MSQIRVQSWRFALCAALSVAGFSVLGWKSWHLQTEGRQQLIKLGQQSHQRIHTIGAKRGAILDRRGQPLAISSRVYSVGIDPSRFDSGNDASIAAIAEALGIKAAVIHSKLREEMSDNPRSNFFYLRRHVSPETKRKVAAASGDPGLVIHEEQKRFYPDRETIANIIGITDIDGRGIEGIEFAREEGLSGQAGKHRFIRDNRGHIIEDLGAVTEPRPGQDIHLSIDRRLQHLAFAELGRVIEERQAQAGSLLILDTRNGEILAMASVPSFNPNYRARIDQERMRNRGAVYIFEPGSTIKPLTVAAALESAEYTPATRIDTGRGELEVHDAVIKDIQPLGEISLAETLIQSSNVGAAKVALDLGVERIWRNLDGFGLGQITNSSFPGETPGRLKPPGRWPATELATHGYGYGFAVTLLQLAQAFTVFANGGVKIVPTFYKGATQPPPERVISAQTAQQVLKMLGDAVSGGTARKAQISGYSVGGKTGTSRKFLKTGGYHEDRYNALFVGIAPLSRPRLVCAIVIDDPQGEYYGGAVAAPLFAKVISTALRLLGVRADLIDGRGV